MPSSPPLPLAITIGEPAGIGIDIILKLWSDLQHSAEDLGLPKFVLLCDPEHLKSRATKMGISLDLELYDPSAGNSQAASTGPLLVCPLKNKLSGEPGVPFAGDAQGIVESISSAVEMVRSGLARGIVTLPINKKSLYDTGFEYPGHTEFLAALAEAWDSAKTPVKPVMMLSGPELRAVPVTIHIPLKDVPAALTAATIVETVQIAHNDLKRRFNIERPRIAVSGLNPHAGEGGTMGNEETDTIIPAILELQESGIECFGPLPADTMFHSNARKKYDLAVCMYHDQALIPAKALAFDETVNVTLGLPFVRTSPDHGTAFDLAGTGRANPSSTLAALRMADEMSRNYVQTTQAS